VPESGDGDCFLPKTGAEVSILGQECRQHLDRDPSFERALMRQIHRGHATASEHALDTVLAQGVTGLQHQRTRAHMRVLVHPAARVTAERNILAAERADVVRI